MDDLEGSKAKGRIHSMTSMGTRRKVEGFDAGKKRRGGRSAKEETRAKKRESSTHRSFGVRGRSREVLISLVAEFSPD